MSTLIMLRRSWIIVTTINIDTYAVKLVAN
jgi:hypothetical protein